MDFDVHQSFVPKGGSINNPDGITGFNFIPVIRAGITSTTGTLEGTVTTEGTEGAVSVDGATVTLYDLENNVVTSTMTDTDGGYTFPGIDPGIYSLEVSATDFETQTAEGVEIVLANKTTQDFTLVATGGD